MKKFMAMLLCAMMLLTNVCGAMAGSMTTAMTIEWDGAYDDVVIGFGGAGAVAAKNAAEDGAKVLIVEKAPEGHEGGNTRYSGQMFAYGMGNLEATRAYYKALGGFENNQEMVETYLGMSDVSIMGSLYNTGDGIKMAMRGRIRTMRRICTC